MNTLIGDVGNTITKICLIESKTFKIKKIIYFDRPKKPYDESYNLGLKIPLILSSILILIYFIYPSILIDVVSTIAIY